MMIERCGASREASKPIERGCDRAGHAALTPVRRKGPEGSITPHKQGRKTTWPLVSDGWISKRREM